MDIGHKCGARMGVREQPSARQAEGVHLLNPLREITFANLTVYQEPSGSSVKRTLCCQRSDQSKLACKLPAAFHVFLRYLFPRGGSTNAERRNVEGWALQGQKMLNQDRGEPLLPRCQAMPPWQRWYGARLQQLYGARSTEGMEDFQPHHNSKR